MWYYHIDENKQNNNVENLEWCTQKYNVKYFRENGRYEKKIGKYNKCSVPIIQCDLQGNFIRLWDCQRDVTRELGINYKGINNCLRNKTKTAYGYIWKYKEVL